MYPQGGVAAQVLGYAGRQPRPRRARAPARALSCGKPGTETFIKDPFGRVLNVVRSVPERPGRDVLPLTLDHTIQANAESVLRSTVSQWGAKGRQAVVLDVQTGGILAMAVAPGFNANRYPRRPSDVHRNATVTDTYEPGSTSARDRLRRRCPERLVTPATPFVLPGSIHVADRVIHDAEPRGTETMTVAQILRAPRTWERSRSPSSWATAARPLDRPVRVR